MLRVIGCVTNCGKRAKSRGLCGEHYGRALARVAAGETTWAALETAGEALPPRTPERRRAWAFTAPARAKGVPE